MSVAFITPPRRILVRGVNWLGDAVMTTPALQRLREALQLAGTEPRVGHGAPRAQRITRAIAGRALGNAAADAVEFQQVQRMPIHAKSPDDRDRRSSHRDADDLSGPGNEGLHPALG